MEFNMSWPPHSNDSFCIRKHLLNYIWVTEAINRPQKPPNMVLYHGKFCQSYSQCPVWSMVRKDPNLAIRILRWIEVTIFWNSFESNFFESLDGSQNQKLKSKIHQNYSLYPFKAGLIIFECWKLKMVHFGGTKPYLCRIPDKKAT